MKRKRPPEARDVASSSSSSPRLCDEAIHRYYASVSRSASDVLASWKTVPLQRPWGGSGDACVVARVATPAGSVVRKHVKGSSKRHAGDPLKRSIKDLSYRVELIFLTRAPSTDVRHARCFVALESARGELALVLEDLSQVGFPKQSPDLSSQQTHLALEWIARFHASTVTSKTLAGVWRRGGYWALDKRAEEWWRMTPRWRASLREHRAFRWESSLAQRLANAASVLLEVLYPVSSAAPVDASLGTFGTYDPRDESPARAPWPAVREWLTTGEEISPSRFSGSVLLRPFLIHGDYKAENLAFNLASTTCASFDFQWVGYGVGLLDVVCLLSSSCEGGWPDAREERAFLETYVRTLCSCLKIESLPTWALTQLVFELCLVDFARYVVGTGNVFADDDGLVRRAESVLRRWDEGRIDVSAETYREKILSEIRGSDAS